MKTLSPPVLEVPIEPLWTGGFMHPQFSIDQASGRIAIAQYTETVNAWESFLYDLPDFAFWVGVLTLAVLLWSVWRVFRTPRAVGRLVCARCAYDLTVVQGASAASKCSECGLDTAKRPPVLGQTALRRLVLPAGLCACVLAVCVAVFVWRLRAQEPFDQTRPWPAFASRLMPGWARFERRHPRVVGVDSVEVWSGPERRRISRIVVPETPAGWGREIRQVRLVPNGNMLGLTQEFVEVALSLHSVADSTILWQSNRAMMNGVRVAGLAGASKDGARVWFWLSRKTTPTQAEIELIEVSTNTCLARSVGKIGAMPGTDVWGFTEVMAVENDADVAWACVVYEESQNVVGWSGGSVAYPGQSSPRSVLQRDPASNAWMMQLYEGSAGGPASLWQIKLDGSPPVHVLIHLLSDGSMDFNIQPQITNMLPKSISIAGVGVAPVPAALISPRWHAQIASRRTGPTRGLWGLFASEGTVDGFVQVWDRSPPKPASKP